MPSLNGLEGIKVVEVAQVAAAPMAGRLLADWGADVIHVEHPLRGDASRTERRPAMGGKAANTQVNYFHENHNRNKRSITVDLSRPDGTQIIHKLLDESDVFINNLRPRELEKFELTYDRLSRTNPRLIAANLSGYGKKGPDKDLPCFDTTGYFARAGVLYAMQSTKSPPILTPLGLGDNVAALAMAYGIMVALYSRYTTGLGQEVDVSIFHTGIFALSADYTAAMITGQSQQQPERRDVVNVLSMLYETKDGRWLRFAMWQPDAYWSKFCRVIGRADLEHDLRFETFQSRIKDHEALYDILIGTFRSRTLAEWKECLGASDLPWAPVQSQVEVIDDAQAQANGVFASCKHPAIGSIGVVTNPVKLSGLTEKIDISAPEFGQHTEEVLLEYGYSWEDIGRFKDKRVIA